MDTRATGRSCNSIPTHEVPALDARGRRGGRPPHHEGPALRGANSELELKSNSYDLSVDIELADAIQRSASSIHP